MKLNRFEDLDCWQEARALTKMVYNLLQENKFKNDYRLIDQITGAVISVMNNIAEGFDSQSNSEFRRFLLYARRSISETQNCLYIAIDQRYINQEQFNSIYEQAEKTRKIIDGLLRYLRSKRN